MVEAGPRGGGARRGVLVAIAVRVLLALGALGIAWWVFDTLAERATASRRKLEELDRRIEAYVPTDRRRIAAPDPAPIEFVVLLKRAPGATTTHLFHRGTDFGEFPDSSANRLADAASAWVGRISAEPGATEARARVEAEPTVPTAEVIQAVDALIAAGMKDVTFVGTPPPGSILDRAAPGGK